MQFSKRTYAALGYAVAGAAALVVTAKPAAAQTQTQQQTISFTSSSGTITGGATGTPTPATSTLSFLKFDSNLGTLTQVQIQYSIQFSSPNPGTGGGISITNAANGNNPATLTEAVASAIGTPSGANETATTTTSAAYTQQLTYKYTGSGSGTHSDTYYFPSSVGGTGVPTAQTTNSSVTQNTQANFVYSITGFATDFEAPGGGTGNTLTASVAPTITVTNGTVASSTTNFQFLSGATITYYYNPVPATPAQTSALIGMAMCGAQFGMVRLRRRRTSKRNIA